MPPFKILRIITPKSEVNTKSYWKNVWVDASGCLYWSSIQHETSVTADIEAKSYTGGSTRLACVLIEGCI